MDQSIQLSPARPSVVVFVDVIDIARLFWWWFLDPARVARQA
jgi:hypothetical protein